MPKYLGMGEKVDLERPTDKERAAATKGKLTHVGAGEQAPIARSDSQTVKVPGRLTVEKETKGRK